MNWQDRQKIREKELLSPNITPVLLLYWNQEDLEVYLLPCSPSMVKKLKKVNGRFCNQVGWEQYDEIFKYIESMRYDDVARMDGPWKLRYLVDRTDEHAESLPPALLPPGTLVIQTGFIL